MRGEGPPREQEARAGSSRETWSSMLSEDSVVKALEVLSFAKTGVEGVMDLYTDDYCRSRLAHMADEIARSAGKVEELADRLRTEVLGGEAKS